jgi:CHAT domain-containing protein
VKNLLRPAALLILGFAAFFSPNSVLAQFMASQAHHASIGDYLPELERLQQKGDWPGVERLSREAADTLQAQQGPDTPDAITAIGWRIRALIAESRYTEAEPLARHALATYEKYLGPEDSRTVNAASLLSAVFVAEHDYAQAEPLARRVLAMAEKTLGPDHPNVAKALANLGEILRSEDRFAEAEALDRRALNIQEKASGSDALETAAYENVLAGAFLEDGRYGEAEPLARHVLAVVEKGMGAENARTAAAVTRLAEAIASQGRYEEGEALFRRAVTINEKALGPENPATAASLGRLSRALKVEGRYAEAELLLRRALVIDEHAHSPHPAVTADFYNGLSSLLRSEHRAAEAEAAARLGLALSDDVPRGVRGFSLDSLLQLGADLQDQRRYADAETVMRRALAVSRKASHGAKDPAVLLNNLAQLLRSEGHFAEAEPLMRSALASAEASPTNDTLSIARQNLAEIEGDLGKFADAVALYRLGCAIPSNSAPRQQNADAATATRADENACWIRFTVVLWYWASHGGGPAARDRPQSLMLEAFAASQRAVQSAAGDAMAHAAALAAAQAQTVGTEAQAYEESLKERDALDRQYAEAVAHGGAGGAEKRAMLAKSRSELDAKTDRLASELKAKQPRYWDFRSPEAVSVAALQSTTGADATLLHSDEALIVFIASMSKGPGIVFAVTKEQIAWAMIALTGDQLTAHVVKLRAEIDPEGYGLIGPNGVPIAGAIAGSFDRQAAYELYQALLGDASIQAAIKSKSQLLFVPSGALLSLPPGLLVTAAPPGGKAKDSDRESLRATSWLLRSKAVSMLPAVASLRTLRQILPGDRAMTSDPLLVFADPDFRRPSAPAKTRSAKAAARGFASYFRDGLPLAEALDGLPNLPGTRIEGEALEKALQGRPGSLLTGREASKAQLMARNADGRLAQVRVLEFATHGLVAGDASDLAEPALALAAGANPADELLLASEAATLKLNAEWVLLSACNTASPDAPQAQGLSGLSRAFFYAGARSLLVSHWRVRDDVAPRLIPAMLLAEREHPNLGRAQALRQASLAVLDDRTINAADPAAWAAFTLVGEAAH